MGRTSMNSTRNNESKSPWEAENHQVIISKNFFMHSTQV